MVMTPKLPKKYMRMAIINDYPKLVLRFNSEQEREDFIKKLGKEWSE